MSYMTPRRSSQNLRPSTPQKTPQPGVFSPINSDHSNGKSASRRRVPSDHILRRHTSMVALPSSTARASSSLGNYANTSAPTFQGAIHVGIRSRPEPNADRQWLVDRENSCISHAAAGDFKYDQVYDGFSTNGDVFESTAKHVVTKVAEGYNGVVFAYGTTGSGKTFSMRGTDSDPGIVNRSVQHLFASLHERRSECTVRVSYIEIYNERVCDLLSGNAEQINNDLQLRDDELLGVRAVGATELDAASASDLLDVIAQGDLYRRTSATQHNEHSSRSHAIVMIQVRSARAHSSLYLCDLAGSERAVSQADRRKEGSYINKSLLSLGSVISRLSAGGGGHISFRDSKLTRLLQPSLSGQALIAVICTVQTNTTVMSETLNTLRFASRAKNIVVNAKYGSLNEDAAAQNNMMIERLLRSLDHLRIENNNLKDQVKDMSSQRDDLQGKLDVVIESDLSAINDSLEQYLELHEADKPQVRITASAPSLLLAEEPAKTDREFPKAFEGSELDQLRERYKLQAEIDRQEIEKLQEQVSELLTKVAEAHLDLEDLRRAPDASSTADIDPAVKKPPVTSDQSGTDNEVLLNKVLADRAELQRQLDRITLEQKNVFESPRIKELEQECADLRIALEESIKENEILSHSAETEKALRDKQSRELEGLRSSLYNSTVEVEALKAKLLRRENEAIRLKTRSGELEQENLQVAVLQAANDKLTNELELIAKESLEKSSIQATLELKIESLEAMLSGVQKQLSHIDEKESRGPEGEIPRETVDNMEQRIAGLEAENARLRRLTSSSSITQMDSDSSRDTVLIDFDPNIQDLRCSKIKKLQQEIACLRIGSTEDPVSSMGEEDDISSTRYLMEEIGDLRNTIADKDRIISFLKKSMERRTTIKKLAPSSSASSRPQSPDENESPFSDLKSPKLRQKSLLFSST